MAKVSLIVIFIFAILTSIWLYRSLYLPEEYVQITGGSAGERYFGMEKTNGENGKSKHKILKFDLVDPECAPEMMLTKILYGYHIMLNTKENAPEYSGNSISCNNCHFNAGNTLGGKNRGISLVGVTAVYPRFSQRSGKNITLAERITSCFKRSLNGKAPAAESLEMESLIAYLAWISHEVSDAPMLPWLGLDDVPSKHIPNESDGEEVYSKNCAICHGPDGKGSVGVPPIWGEDSFNDGAGMNTLPMLSSFVWQNMPYGQPILTPEEALDVAAFVISKNRPHLNQ